MCLPPQGICLVESQQAGTESTHGVTPGRLRAEMQGSSVTTLSSGPGNLYQQCPLARAIDEALYFIFFLPNLACLHLQYSISPTLVSGLLGGQSPFPPGGTNPWYCHHSSPVPVTAVPHNSPPRLNPFGDFNAISLLPRPRTCCQI